MIFSKEQIVGLTLFKKIDDWSYDFNCKTKDIKNNILAPWRFLRNVWLFRKEMWKFRRWDHHFNLEIFTRSLVLTAEHLDSENCITTSGHQDAANIRKFIRMLEIGENSIQEAERVIGRDYFEVHNACYPGEEWGVDNQWMNKSPTEWSQAQKDYRHMHDLIHQLEERNWKNAWKFYARKGRCWWE